MKRLKLILNTTIIALSLFVPLTALPASGIVWADAQSEINQGINDANGGSQVKSPESSINTTIANITNVLSAAVGIVAVIMIIIAGLRYTSSAGNPEAAKGAKNTILYAVIGLVIVAIAQVIVHFVLHSVG